MSDNKKYFYLDESPIYKNKYMIRMNHDYFLFPNGTNGSYNVFIARVLNLSYAQFLRYCRDKVGAELIGKNQRYVIPLFDNTAEAKMLVKLLNARMSFIMNEHEYPYNYKEEADGTVSRTSL